MAKLVVTSRSRELAGTAARLVRHLNPGARVRRSPFRGVLVVEVEGDVLELAQAVNRKCARCTGHATVHGWT